MKGTAHLIYVCMSEASKVCIHCNWRRPWGFSIEWKRNTLKNESDKVGKESVLRICNSQM